MDVRQPAPPADLQPHVEVELEDGADEVYCRQHQPYDQLLAERTAVFVLQGVEKVVVPFVDQHGDGDEAEVESNDGREQTARSPPFFGKPVRLGERPDLAQEGGGGDGRAGVITHIGCLWTGDRGHGAGYAVRTSGVTKFSRQWTSRRAAHGHC